MPNGEFPFISARDGLFSTLRKPFEEGIQEECKHRGNKHDEDAADDVVEDEAEARQDEEDEVEDGRPK